LAEQPFFWVLWALIAEDAEAEAREHVRQEASGG
jgi:hypothetical protein